MNTAIPETGSEAAKGWVLYDGECPFCIGTVHRFKNLLWRHGFAAAPLQSDWVVARFGWNSETSFKEMLVLLPDGRVVGGADGLVQIARRIWWAWPMFALAQIPGMMILLRAGYRYIAARRHCLSGICGLPKPPHRHAHGAFFEMP